MVASCRLDTLRVVNEFQDELSGSEAWFLHSNSRDKLTVFVTSLSSRQWVHHNQHVSIKGNSFRDSVLQIEPVDKRPKRDLIWLKNKF
ncbi:hypothetical protein YC2023_101846 [Brassica napus]